MGRGSLLEEVNCQLHPFGEAVNQSRDSRCIGPGASMLCLRARGRQKKEVDETDGGKPGLMGENLGDRSGRGGNSLRGWKQKCGLEGHHQNTLGVFSSRRGLDPGARGPLLGFKELSTC